MEDDFNTALALGYLHELTRVINRVLGEKSFRKDPSAPSLLRMGKECLLGHGHILGLFQEPPAEYFAGQRRRFLEAKGIGEEEIRSLIAEREEARKSKDFARADDIRNRALARGIALEDGPQGTTWRPAT